MDPSGFVDGEFAVDLESGRSHDGSVTTDERASLMNYDVDQVHSVVVIDVKAESIDVDVNEVKLVKEEKRKKISNKKPPRPPRGPSLDAADLKFIKEITELTMLKRVRTERIKALKKMKAAKTSSSSASNSLFATMFTVIFCCVILLQGFSNRTSSHASVDGSPISLAPEPGLISVQYVGIPYAINSSMLVSGSPSIVEQVSGQDTHGIANSVSG